MSAEAAIREALHSGRYALVGAGQLGEMSLAQWPADVARPQFILDSVRTGHLGGIEIRDLGTHVADPNITYLLSAFKMKPSAIRAIFDHLGQSAILTVYDFFEEFTPALFSNGWRNLAPSRDLQDRLHALPGYYADAESGQICNAVTAWRYGRDLVDDFSVGAEDIKYDLRLFGRAGWHYDVIYDGGAFDLGLLDHLAASDISWGKVIAFEPDPAHHATCNVNKRRWETATGETILIDPRALTDRGAVAPFVANGLFSSRLIADETVVHKDMIDVTTCRLDEAHRAWFGSDGDTPLRILLKLHVEGEEFAALRGAGDLLARHDVDLLINLSHDEESYTRIAPYLNDIGRHDLLLRCHALFGEGLTLFARCTT